MTAVHAIALAEELGIEIVTDANGRRVESDGIRRAAARGDYVRVAPAAYLDTARWRALDADGRFRAFLVGMATGMREDTVFSHRSAAFMLKISMLGRWPSRVETTAPPAPGGRSSTNVRRYGAPLRDDEIVELAGFRVTSPARTVADLARTATFADAVAAADSALHRKRRGGPLLTLEELHAEADSQKERKGFVRLGAVAGFATPLSDSVRESQSRVLIHELGFPPPVLQQSWYDSLGRIGDSDFWWPDHDLVGEYDGHTKYIKPEYLRGRTPGQTVEDEKRREDRIRATGQKVTRWQTEHLTRAGLARKLAEAGLPQAFRLGARQTRAADSRMRC